MGRAGKYSGDSLDTYEKILDGRSSYIPNKVYKNEKYDIYYFINYHGYIHILKPCAVKMNAKVLYYAIEDFLLTRENVLQSQGWNEKFPSIEKAIEELENKIL